jgi:hypothetical protein
MKVLLTGKVSCDDQMCVVTFDQSELWLNWGAYRSLPEVLRTTIEASDLDVYDEHKCRIFNQDRDEGGPVAVVQIDLPTGSQDVLLEGHVFDDIAPLRGYRLVTASRYHKALFG